MNKPEKDIKKELKGMARALMCRLLKNESKTEQTVFLTALASSTVFFLLNVIHQIIAANVAGIVLSLTVELAIFLLVVLLPINDLYFVKKQRSWITVIYSAICILYAVKGFFGVGFVGIVISVIGIAAALAFYGTVIYDQFIIEDTPVKYWLIYGGAAYKVLYALVMLIINCVNGGGVVAVLWGIIGAVAEISVILMLLWLFDEFSFARYLFGEIIDGDVDDEDEAEKTVAVDESEPVIDDEQIEDIVSADLSNEIDVEESHDDTDDSVVEYVPYLEDESEPEIEEEPEVEEEPKIEEEPENEEEPEIEEEPENEEEPEIEEEPETEEVSKTDEEPEVEEEPEIEEAPQVEPEPENMEDEVLDDDEYSPYDDINDPVPESGEQQSEAESAIDTEANDNDEIELDTLDSVDIEETVEESVTEEIEEETPEISPIELKYARFAAENNKPDDTMSVEGMSGDRFDVWVNEDTICFLNDLYEAVGGRGVRSAVIPFDDVTGLGADKLSDGTECIVLSYNKDSESREIRFTRDSFAAFKQVMESAADDE